MSTIPLTLSVLVPINITDAMFISSTAAENDYNAWSAATTYALGTKVISPTTHRIYESAQAGNLNHDPTDINNLIGTTTLWWIDIDPTNKWAMFDGEVGTQTTIVTPLTTVLRPGFFNAIYMGKLVGEQADISIKDAPGGSVIYTYSGNLEDSQPGDYWEHFFMPFRQQQDLLLRDIPPYYNMEITSTISSVSGSVACGISAVGDLRPLGMTEWDAEAIPKTYSYIGLDKFGRNEIRKRPSANDMQLTATFDRETADFVYETIKALLDVPCVWIGIDLASGYSPLRVFGLGSGRIKYKNAKEATVDLSVKGGI